MFHVQTVLESKSCACLYMYLFYFDYDWTNLVIKLGSNLFLESTSTWSISNLTGNSQITIWHANHCSTAIFVF